MISDQEPAIDEGRVAADAWRRLRLALVRYIEQPQGPGSPLSPMSAMVLMAVADAPHFLGVPLSQTQLTAFLHTDPSTMSRVLAELVERGFCQVVKANDRRRNHPVITDAGRDALLQYADTVIRMPETVFKQISHAPDFRSVTGQFDDLLERHLQSYFHAARGQRNEPTRSSM